MHPRNISYCTLYYFPFPKTYHTFFLPKSHPTLKKSSYSIFSRSLLYVCFLALATTSVHKFYENFWYSLASISFGIRTISIVWKQKVHQNFREPVLLGEFVLGNNQFLLLSFLVLLYLVILNLFQDRIRCKSDLITAILLFLVKISLFSFQKYWFLWQIFFFGKIHYEFISLALLLSFVLPVLYEVCSSGRWWNRFFPSINYWIFTCGFRVISE